VPSTTWTPRAVASEAVRLRRRLWRAVEAQHIASTLRLVQDVEEQILLERILESSKPALPEQAQHLHYLLATPFRYPSPSGSRFRSNVDPGVWYGAEQKRTACAELGYWRWRFLSDSAGLESLGPSPQTLFLAGIGARCADLTRTPFSSERAAWTLPDDYTATQRFGLVAREAGLGAIRYESVRDPEHATAVAVLRPQCFNPPQPLQRQTWFLTVKASRVTWQRDAATFEFSVEDWSSGSGSRVR
jgi:hypothetical protein